MKITFISFYFLNPGVRFLSSYLKAAGHSVQLVFLPPDDMYRADETYPHQVIVDLMNICGDSDVIGISVLTNDYFRAAAVTRHLKSKLKAPVVWGGIHPTIIPRECPKEADYIYIGEGEEGIAEFLERLSSKKKLDDMKNLAFWRGGRFIQNELRALMQPAALGHFQDFGLEGHYIREGSSIVSVTPARVEKNLYRDFEDDVPAYLAIFSRGCIHGCTYCCNNKINKLYEFERSIYRSKPVESMIAELESVLGKFPFIKFVFINDDNFLANPVEFIALFAHEYGERIRIPFKVLGSPYYISDRKIAVLKAAGLREVHIGVQSGSERVNRDIYKRRISRASVIAAAEIINRHHLRGRYDFIFDNPYETRNDLYETARLIHCLPKPYIFQPFSLTFFPGTELYDRAKADGTIIDERRQVYEKQSNGFYPQDVSYLKLVCLLLPRMPRTLGSILLFKPFVFVLHRSTFMGAYEGLYRLIVFMKERLHISVRSLYKQHESV